MIMRRFSHYVTTAVVILRIFCEVCLVDSLSIREDGTSFSQGRPSLHMDAVGMGTAAMQEKTEELVCEGIKAGFRMFDTAQAREWYFEEGLGKALARCGGGLEVTVVTKVHPRSFEESSMRLAVQQSISLLYVGQLDARLDVLLLHSPRCWRGHCTREQQQHDWREGWRNLEVMKQEGLVRHIGVSNFDERELRELLGIANRKVAVVQNWMDPFHQDVAVRRLAEQHGVVYMAYSSLGTQWGEKEEGNPVWTSAVLLEIATSHGVGVSDVVLSWLKQEGVVSIPRASRSEHIQQNARMGTADGFLTKEELEKIRALDGTAGSPWD